MNKQEFLEKLRKSLSGLPENEIEDQICFYGEMIDERTEECGIEEQAVDGIGSVEEITAKIISEYPLAKLVKEKVRLKRKPKAWEITLLILGSPLWLPLLIAAFAVITAVCVTLWALIVSLWAVEISVTAYAFCMLTGALVVAVGGNVQWSVFLGEGLLSAGLCIFLFYGCRAASKGAYALTKKTAFGIKNLIIGRSRDNE